MSEMPSLHSLSGLRRFYGKKRGIALRVVFPLRGPGKPPGAEISEKGEKYMYFSELFYPFFGAIFPFSGVGPGRGIL